MLSFNNKNTNIIKLNSIDVFLVGENRDMKINNETLREKGKGNFSKSRFSRNLTLKSLKTIKDLKEFIKKCNWPIFNNYKNKTLHLLVRNSLTKQEPNNTEWSNESPLGNRYITDRYGICKLDLYTDNNIKTDIIFTNKNTGQAKQVKVDVRDLYKYSLYRNILKSIINDPFIPENVIKNPISYLLKI